MREIRQEGNYSFLFTRYAEPVAHVAPGETVAIYTEDAMSGLVRTYEDIPNLVRRVGGNPEVGPVYVEGAEPGDTLAVKLYSIEFPRERAVSRIHPQFGALEASGVTSMLHDPLEMKFFIYEKEKDSERYTCLHNKGLSFTPAPFAGCIATAPPMEAIAAIHPFNQGGNIDIPDVKPGNTVYLPVKVPGAYFFIGDCHVRQGEGEITGTALEAAAKVTLSFEVIKADKGMRTAWPRIESETQYMAVGAAGDLLDSCRIALVELISWLEELGWDKWDAYHMLSQAAELNVGCIASASTMSMVAKVDKEVVERYLKYNKK